MEHPASVVNRDTEATRQVDPFAPRPDLITPAQPSRPDRLDSAIAVGVAALLSTIAFVGGGGLQIGPVTLIEAVVIGLASLAVAAAVFLVGFHARVNGAFALAGFAGLASVTALSITWSLFPATTWLEANRTLSYLAAFAGGIAFVRLAHGRWAALMAGVLGALSIVSLYALATKVLPGLLDADEVYARLRAPFDYWNAVGLTGAMGIPLALWLGTRPRVADWVSALAYPLMALFTLAILMSYSRGSILAALAGAALWIAFVPVRLRSLLVLVIPIAVSGVISAWAFSTGALADDNVALSRREDYGIYFGLILAAALALLFLVGLLIARRANSRPLSDAGRRKAGIAAGAVAVLIAVTGLGLLAGTGNGIGGRLHDLTHEQGTPSNSASRLQEAGSVRTVYWARALKIHEAFPFHGAGAGAFGTAQLRYRDNAAQAQHAHGYVHQTLADLGWLGLGVSVLAMVAWLVAATATIGMRRGRWRRPWSEQRIALAALTTLVIVFGVHSAIDWTWFIPFVAITAFLCAGWIAGRGALGDEPVREGGAATLEGVGRLSMPSRDAIFRRLPATVLVLATGVIAVLAVIQPWRADQKSEQALKAASAGDLAVARQFIDQAKQANPFSTEPYFDQAAADQAAGDNSDASRNLQLAVEREPANPVTWTRLGRFYLQQLDEPTRAIPVLRAAVYLDPYSAVTKGLLVQAIRAEQIKRQKEAARRAAARAAKQDPTLQPGAIVVP